MNKNTTGSDLCTYMWITMRMQTRMELLDNVMNVPTQRGTCASISYPYLQPMPFTKKVNVPLRE